MQTWDLAYKCNLSLTKFFASFSTTSLVLLRYVNLQSLFVCDVLSNFCQFVECFETNPTKKESFTDMHKDAGLKGLVTNNNLSWDYGAPAGSQMCSGTFLQGDWWSAPWGTQPTAVTVAGKHLPDLHIPVLPVLCTDAQKSVMRGSQLNRYNVHAGR